MAILQRTVNGSFTEIYIGGGNGWITQSAPTNFHHFWRQKLLDPDESIDDFREVSETEKQQLLDSDAKWIEPSEEFIAECEGTGEVVFNRTSGFFELNTLVDITTKQMQVIMRESSGANFLCDICHACSNARTFLQVRTPQGSWSQSTIHAFAHCKSLEVLSLGWYAVLSDDTVKGCFKLRKIIGAVRIKSSGVFYTNLTDLEDVQIVLDKDIRIPFSPKLSLTSIEYMVNNSINTAPITITLHPTAYARVTDEIFAAAAEKQITIAST